MGDAFSHMICDSVIFPSLVHDSPPPAPSLSLSAHLARATEETKTTTQSSLFDNSSRGTTTMRRQVKASRIIDPSFAKGKSWSVKVLLRTDNFLIVSWSIGHSLAATEALSSTHLPRPPFLCNLPRRITAPPSLTHELTEKGVAALLVDFLGNPLGYLVRKHTFAHSTHSLVLRASSVPQRR